MNKQKYTLEEIYDAFQVSGIEINERNLLDLIHEQYKQRNDIERPKSEFGRRVGNTTRLIDYYIQLLFQKGSVEIKDHYDHRESHKKLTDKILRRIELEHPFVKLKRISPIRIKII